MVKRFGVGFVCGYLLGARSGRERYDQLAEAGRRFMDLPVVRDVMGSGEDRLRELGHRVADTVRDAFGDDSGAEGPRGTKGAGDRRHSGASGDGVTTVVTDGDVATDESAPDDAEDGEEPPRQDRRPRRRAAGEVQRQRIPQAGTPSRASRGGTSGRASETDRRREQPRPSRRGGRSGLARAAVTALERGRTD